LDGLGETNAVVVKVKDRVVGADEHITENPERTHWWWYIETHETRDALDLRAVLDLENVVVGSQVVVDGSNGEGDVGQVGDHAKGAVWVQVSTTVVGGGL
jgi:hypothetical protein